MKPTTLPDKFRTNPDRFPKMVQLSSQPIESIAGHFLRKLSVDSVSVTSEISNGHGSKAIETQHDTVADRVSVYLSGTLRRTHHPLFRGGVRPLSGRKKKECPRSARGVQ